jgi:hypothetical protein
LDASMLRRVENRSTAHRMIFEAGAPSKARLRSASSLSRT